MNKIRPLHRSVIFGWIVTLMFGFYSCGQTSVSKSENQITAKEILGNNEYQAICYGGYRERSLNIQPSIKELKQDMLILHAMGIRIVRTYKLHFPHAENLVKAINELKAEIDNFEMYVMLGAWIDCKDARTANPIHSEESPRNESEIENAIRIANSYPDIVKIIAVGNEAMVHWQAQYFVEPKIILKWVNHLQKQKSEGALDKDIWITCSDNFASWGGGGPEYHNDDLTNLMQAVDYISIHTYPMHDTHYNPSFWQLSELEMQWEDSQKIDSLMWRALNYATSQYKAVEAYMKSKGVDKPIHIGETGWASSSNGFYGPGGSKACDEVKQKIFYDHILEWSQSNDVSCFFFEAFDEIWKDSENPGGSENHFGLFTIDGKAKYALWNKVDEGIFKGLKRGENDITKSFGGELTSVLESISVPDATKPASK